ncbi:MAG: DUF3240 family protein [Halothiobacillaceae bacterium]|nr:DUF3240 family protein [Halothiobacillaceae bacterium]
MMSASCLLVLIAPVALEETLADWIEERFPGQPWTLLRVEGHGSHGLPMSVYEQVLGRVHLVEARIETTPQAARDGMCEWRERYPGAAVRAWMLPLLAL